MAQFVRGQIVKINDEHGKIYRVDYTNEIITVIFTKENVHSIWHYGFDGQILGNKMSEAIVKQEIKMGMHG